MNFQNISDFINQISNQYYLDVIDHKYCEQIRNYMKSRGIEEILNQKDIDFVLELFSKRWAEVIDTQYDYTLNVEGSNSLWIKLAKYLAVETGKEYYQILMPTIVNTQDYNNGSRLSETETPDNFYLGLDNKVLYRKRGLCELIIQNHYQLVTKRSCLDSKPSNLSFKELYRLKSCAQSRGKFSIDNDEFTSFWNFLQKKVFPNMQSRGNLPILIVPELIEFIELYFKHKSVLSDYSVIKNKLIDLIDQLEQNHRVQDIYYFYSMQLKIKKGSLFLIDLLIDLYSDDDYQLGEELSILAKSLYELNPVLEVNRTELKETYKQVITPKSNNKSVDFLLSCKQLLLSLFVHPFVTNIFTAHIIQFWDIQNTVDSDANEIFSLLIPHVIDGNKQSLISAYSTIFTNIVRPYISEKGIWKWFSHSTIKDKWFEGIENNTLQNLNIYWFDPEVLIHALLQYKCASLQNPIKEFLNQLIRTYAQANSDLSKQLRVNIKFSDFLNALDKTTKSKLIQFIQLINPYEAHKAFLSNCTVYIEQTLDSIASGINQTSPHFFTDKSSSQNHKTSMISKPCACISTLITHYKSIVDPKDTSTELSKTDQNILDYLSELSRPILSIQDTDKLTRSNSFYYLNQ